MANNYVLLCYFLDHAALFVLLFTFIIYNKNYV